MFQCVKSTELKNLCSFHVTLTLELFSLLPVPTQQFDALQMLSSSYTVSMEDIQS